MRALRAAGYAPWLAIHEPGTYAARSRAIVGTVSVPDPALDSEAFLQKLAAAVERLSVVAVLPSMETHLLALTGREADFPGVAFGAPSPESVELVTNKDILPELTKTAGLQTPPTTRITRGNSESVGMFGFPTVVKPRRSRIRNMDGTVSAYSARYAVSAEQAEKALENLPGGEGLVQPYIPGALVGVSGVSWEGELVCALHQVSVRIWPVPMGDHSYAETVPLDAELEKGVSRLLQETGWSGLFQMEFIRTTCGEYYLIDLNPRIYGSIALAVAAGLNLPGIWVDLLLGQRPEVGSYLVGARFRHEEKDVRALAQMLVDGEQRGALRGLVPRRGTTHAVFSLRDPMPLLTSGAKLAKRLKR